MRLSKLVAGVVLCGICAAVAGNQFGWFKTSEQLNAECAVLTAHPDEKLPKVAGITSDKLNAAQGIAACRRAVDRDRSPRAIYGLGRALYAGRKYAESIVQFEAALSTGYRPDLSYTGLASAWYGDGSIEANLAKAVETGRKAVAAGYVPANYTLGFALGKPRSTTYDFDAAVRALEKSASHPVTARASYSRLVDMYSEAEFARKDLAKVNAYALQWLSLDDPRALYVLGTVYADKTFRDADPVKAFRFFKSAAEREVADSYSRLGSAYYFGNGTPENSTEALKWLRRAADDGHPWSNYVVGHMYFNGRGAAKDAFVSEQYITKAVSLGNPDAKLFNDKQLAPLLIGLRNMPKTEAQKCLTGRRSAYDNTRFEIYSSCETSLNVLVCKNYALTDLISIFTEKDATRCDVKRIGGRSFVDSMYLANDNDSLGWQLISGSRIQWSACHVPLSPKFVGKNQIRCEW